MAMVVKNNMSAINTLNTLNKNSSALSKSLQKVSSGMKINGAADDASGYAISERMRVQIRSLDQANQNTQNGSSMMKVAEGAVSSTVDILKTLKEKAVNAANDTNTDSDRQTIQKELDQSIDQINDNANITFNGKYLVDGSKNTKGNATYTALSNQSLGTDTTADTALTALTSRSGDSLEIHDTDKVTVSYVQGGNTYSTTFSVKDENGNVATLKDIFKNAEDIDKKTQIFASGDNASVLEARKADEGLSPDDAKNIAAVKQAAIHAKDDAKTELDTKITALAGDVDVTALKTAVIHYNEASAAWAGVVGASNGVGTTQISTDGAANDGEYLDKLAGSAAYKAAAGGLDIDATKGKLTAAGTAADGATDLATAATAAKAALAGDPFEAALGKAIDDYVTANPTATQAELKTILDTWSGYAGDINTKSTALKTAGDMEITPATGAPVAGSGYANYVTAKNDYAAKKLAADKYTDPYLLTGKTVGVAGSNDNVTTASGENAITITANKDGVLGQISGLNISISDSQGNVKKSANAALDAFGETIRGQNASQDNAISLQVGTNANQSIKVGLTDMRAEALGLQGSDGTKLNISTQTKANAAINVLDNAIQKALDQQTTIGAIESRLDYTSSNLTTASENVQASESTIRDADMAKEMTNYTKNNVLLQAAQSMLAQANQSSSNVLSLLQ